jgi:chromosome segregation ATPase
MAKRGKKPKARAAVKKRRPATRRRRIRRRRSAKQRPAPKRTTARTGALDQVARLQAARRRLERRLVAAVQEIGMLRQYELRVAALEAEIQKRDADLADLKGRYESLESRLGGAAVVGQ